MDIGCDIQFVVAGAHFVANFHSWLPWIIVDFLILNFVFSYFNFLLSPQIYLTELKKKTHWVGVAGRRTGGSPRTALSIRPSTNTNLVLSTLGKTGFASYEVNVNSPPHGGECEFLPKQGIALKTPFNFTCRNWIDDQENTRQPLSYKLFYTSPVDPSYNFLVYHGPRNTLNNIYLPSGHEEKNYTYQISIRVEDVYGAFGKTVFSIRVCIWYTIISIGINLMQFDRYLWKMAFFYSKQSLLILLIRLNRKILAQKTR